MPARPGTKSRRFVRDSLAGRFGDMDAAGRWMAQQGTFTWSKPATGCYPAIVAPEIAVALHELKTFVADRTEHGLAWRVLSTR